MRLVTNPNYTEADDRLRRSAFVYGRNRPPATMEDRFDSPFHSPLYFRIMLGTRLVATLRLTRPSGVVMAWTDGAAKAPNGVQSADISRITIAEDLRGQDFGLFQPLTTLALGFCEASGIQHVNLVVRPECRTLRYFRRIGFRQTASGTVNCEDIQGQVVPVHAMSWDATEHGRGIWDRFTRAKDRVEAAMGEELVVVQDHPMIRTLWEVPAAG